jgi:hypothetical protein
VTATAQVRYPAAVKTLLALSLLPLLGCKPATLSSPDAAYRAFLQHAHSAHEGKGEKELLADFDSSTRAALQARASEATHATSEALPADPGYQLTLGGAAAPAVAEIRVASASASEAVLQVVLDGGATLPVKMVLEGGSWRVHLDALP